MQPPPRNDWLLVESLLATVLTLVLATRLALSSGWLILPVALLIGLGRSLEAYGLDLRLTPPSLPVHLVLGAALLGLYAAGYAVVAWLFLGHTFELTMPANPAAELLRQFLAVGIPEEVFFRGYIQTNLNRFFGKPWQLFGARVGAGLVVQAAAFAVCHLVTGSWTQLQVFFFALLAGWLRERSGAILAPAVYHAAGNWWHLILALSFRSL